MNFNDAAFLAHDDLQRLIDVLAADGYEVIAPRVQQQAITLGPIRSAEDLPWGQCDRQGPGRYRLEPSGRHRAFDFNVGPTSWKRFLFPPQASIMHARLDDEGWHFDLAEVQTPRYSFLGVRACDLAAIEVQDRVFTAGEYVDPIYQQLREQALVIVVECNRTAATCFCHAWGTGPRCRSGFDLAMTELDDGFLVDCGSERGQAVLDKLPLAPASPAHRHAAEEQISETEQSLTKRFEVGGVAELLMRNLEHPAWDDVAERCLSCTNCTMVCPTCFCSSVDDVQDLSDDSVERVRRWDSCFNERLSYTCGGTARPDIRSRYRQWLTHKLATWHDQFDTSGCVGCGRCITWCPVGIDLTEEVEQIRGG
jgi:formate hydrogenlyase subunit 6/NADH:ubiquinone oxidoreductase subunit I